MRWLCFLVAPAVVPINHLAFAMALAEQVLLAQPADTVEKESLLFETMHPSWGTKGGRESCVKCARVFI